MKKALSFIEIDELAFKLGRNLVEGDVVFPVPKSPIKATTSPSTRFLPNLNAKSLGIKENVKSPTFNS
jgi:tRNA A37 threonylcarbamoyladenosine biosynthesis protein TsaE